jgi:pentatricopeptide repeat protein
MFDEAIKEYEKAIAIDKNFFFSYNALLDLYAKTKNFNEYNKILERLKNTPK